MGLLFDICIVGIILVLWYRYDEKHKKKLTKKDSK